MGGRTKATLGLVGMAGLVASFVALTGALERGGAVAEDPYEIQACVDSDEHWTNSGAEEWKRLPGFGGMYWSGSVLVIRATNPAEFDREYVAPRRSTTVGGIEVRAARYSFVELDCLLSRIAEDLKHRSQPPGVDVVAAGVNDALNRVVVEVDNLTWLEVIRLRSRYDPMVVPREGEPFYYLE